MSNPTFHAVESAQNEPSPLSGIQPSMIAEIIAVGSEMLTPHRVDTNSLYLTEHLNNIGVQVAFKTIVGDSLTHLTEAARIAISRADIILFSGGLGPT